MRLWGLIAGAFACYVLVMAIVSVVLSSKGGAKSAFVQSRGAASLLLEPVNESDSALDAVWTLVDVSRRGPVAVCVFGPLQTLPAHFVRVFPKAQRAQLQWSDPWTSCRVIYVQLTAADDPKALRLLDSVVPQMRFDSVLAVAADASVRDPPLPFVAAHARFNKDVVFVAHGRPSVLPEPESLCGLKFVPPGDSYSSKPPPFWVVMWDDSGPFQDAAVEYCRANNYGLVTASRQCFHLSFPSHWGKVALLKHLLTDYRKVIGSGWMFWLDEHALITNTSYRLESIVSRFHRKRDEVRLMVGIDVQPPYLVNCNLWLLNCRHAEQSVALLDSLWAVAGAHNWQGSDPYWDQNSLNHVVDLGRKEREYEFWARRILLLPHGVLGKFMRQSASIDADLIAGHWRRGDFVALMGSGVVKHDADKQAKWVRENMLAPTASATTKLQWYDGSTYRYPMVLRYVTRDHVLPIDTYVEASAPTLLKFENLPKETWSTNPSCAWRPDGSGVICVVRNVPYDLRYETGEYIWPKNGTSGTSYVHFFTLSKAQYMESGGQTVSIPKYTEMDIPKKVSDTFHPWIEVKTGWYRYVSGGFEDMKLFMVDQELYGFCTCHQCNPSGHCEMIMVPLRDHVMVDAHRMLGFRLACHKNWMPFRYNNSVVMVEKPDPLVLLKVNMTNGHVTAIHEEYMHYWPGLDLRGTSNGLTFHNGFLFLVHETIRRGKLYIHRFMYLEPGADGKFLNRKLTAPFYFSRYCVEFGIGLNISPTKDRLIIGFGIEDKESALLTINITSPEEFLKNPFWMPR